MRNGKVLLLAAMFLSTSALFAQQPPAANKPMPMPPGQTMQMPMPAEMAPMDCQAMMDKMQVSAKAMDDRLAGLVSDMNKANGSAKVDRMAAVINEMVTQRKQMRDDMAAMMPQMMQHMMQHMQSGGMKGGMQSMADCPMMKGMSDKAQPSATQAPAAPHKH